MSAAVNPQIPLENYNIVNRLGKIDYNHILNN